MAKKVSIVLFGLFILGLLFFIGYGIGKGAGSMERDATAHELSDFKQSIGTVGARNAELERRLNEITDLARDSSSAVNTAICQASRITDSAVRIKILIGAIRSALADLYKILDKGQAGTNL